MQLRNDKDSIFFLTRWYWPNLIIAGSIPFWQVNLGNHIWFMASRNFLILGSKARSRISFLCDVDVITSPSNNDSMFRRSILAFNIASINELVLRIYILWFSTKFKDESVMLSVLKWHLDFSQFPIVMSLLHSVFAINIFIDQLFLVPRLYELKHAICIAMKSHSFTFDLARCNLTSILKFLFTCGNMLRFLTSQPPTIFRH